MFVALIDYLWNRSSPVLARHQVLWPSHTSTHIFKISSTSKALDVLTHTDSRVLGPITDIHWVTKAKVKHDHPLSIKAIFYYKSRLK